MYIILTAALAALAACSPLFIPAGTRAFGVICALVCSLLFAGFFYLDPPALVNPFWGGAGVCVFVFSCAAAFFAVALNKGESSGRRHLLPVAIPLTLLVLIGLRGFANSGAFAAEDYAALLGKVETREWTADVQPKDQQHVRKVPVDYATWVANKQLGAADGAIGSQFEIDLAHTTIQMVGGELWHIVPLQFKDWGTWNASKRVPGYIMVSAEDPNRKPVTHFDREYRYMPSAFFSHELYRHLWTNGLADVGMTDFSFEVDEQSRAWWVVTLTHPTLGWSGDVVDGVAIVDPSTGDYKRYALKDVPEWVDRVMPAALLEEYMTWRGKFHAGWWNSWLGETDNTEPETLTFVHGSDDQPYFYADITSTGKNDAALIGLMYANARTGKATYYKVRGMTTTASIQTVDAKVNYRHWHGEDPVLYNLYGTKANIVPLLAENNTYQGVAIVNIEKDRDVAIGTDMLDAMRKYQAMLSGDSNASPELSKRTLTVTGVVARISPDVGTQGTQYYLLLKDGTTAFVSGSELSPVPLTREGDTVTLTYVDSGEAIEPLLAFQNSTLRLNGKVPAHPAPAQQQ